MSSINLREVLILSRKHRVDKTPRYKEIVGLVTRQLAYNDGEESSRELRSRLRELLESDGLIDSEDQGESMSAEEEVSMEVKEEDIEERLKEERRARFDLEKYVAEKSKEEPREDFDLEKYV